MLREGGPRAAGGASHRRWRLGVVVAQAAFAALLAVGAVLMAKTLGALTRIDVGFEPRGVLTAAAVAAGSRLSGRARRGPFLPRAARGDAPAARGEERGPLALAAARRVDRRLGHHGRGLRRAGAGHLGRLAGRVGRSLGDARRAPRARTLPRARRRRERARRGRRQRVHGAPVLARPGPDRPPLPDRPATAAVGHAWSGVVGDVRHNGITGVVKAKFYRPLAQFHRSRGGDATRDMALAGQGRRRPARARRGSAGRRAAARSRGPGLARAHARRASWRARSPRRGSPRSCSACSRRSRSCCARWASTASSR